MAQVQTPREFKFVGGPSRKRRRNGTAPAAASSHAASTSSPSSTSSSKQAKRSRGPSAAGPVRSPRAAPQDAPAVHRPLPSSPLPLFDVDLLSGSPRSVFARMPMAGDGGEGVHPDITNTIAATLAGLASSGHTAHGLRQTQTSPLPHHSSSPASTDSSCASIHNSAPTNAEPIGSAGNRNNLHTTNNSSNNNNNIRYGNNTPTPGLDGMLDWPAEEFMNPFFPAVTLDAAMFGGNNVNNANNDNNAATAMQSTPAMMLPLPSPSPPQMSSLPALAPPPRTANTLADDVEELPSHLDTLSAIQLPSPLSAFCFDASASNGKQVQVHQQHQQHQQHNQNMTIPADALLMATSPRMYAQPSALYDTISRIFFQYDQEFCILPLTCDFAANPFRYNMQAMQQSSLLRHCILALSYRHVDHDTGACTTEATSYKRRATQMLQDRIHIEATGESPPDASLLDASIILMTLDCATSALGPWQSHLRRAKRLIQSARPNSTAAGAKSASSPTPSNASSASSPSSASSTSSNAPPRHSSQRLAQLGLLVWFDVTLALTSRKGCIFSERTIMSIFDPPEPTPGQEKGPASAAGAASSSALDFYAISGCPRELFECMIRLAAYAREMQIASTLSCVRFDMGPVLRLERRIAQWRSPAFDDPAGHHLRESNGGMGRQVHNPGFGGSADDAESAAAEHLWRTRNIAVEGQDDGGSVLDYRLDLYHCAEAWRYALLIYIERVFKWQDRKAAQRRADEAGDDAADGNATRKPAPTADNGDLLQFLARRTLNHVTSCRRTTFVQKQLMLPVFLAGAELRDAGLRNDARDYCAWWGTKTRYNMFITARALLEDVWRRRVAAGEDVDVWWGELFDQKGQRADKEYLLG
ncbi:hypothetical protein HMPREF1624_03570 [Sporothrix schenckii ATCC 58251]|uniref:Transcription factor domain-containing protein n=1 Tax=Sporothrix schenckii (strain ATCC 58251 / de Perez 2211183) TaxID=1391915 RepID=U7PX12_SPOS1|nr:hypothetical protein HMPREF1624_03570 [Sporothrix schenckii ATCC 58251]